MNVLRDWRNYMPMPMVSLMVIVSIVLSIPVPMFVPVLTLVIVAMFVFRRVVRVNLGILVPMRLSRDFR